MHDQFLKNINLLLAKIGTLVVYLAEASRWMLGVQINDVLTIVLTVILIVYWSGKTWRMIRDKRDKNKKNQ